MEWGMANHGKRVNVQKRSTGAEEVRTLLTTLQNAWNKHDMRLFGSVFAIDADFVNVGGIRWKGQAEIEMQHSTRHRMQFKESRMKLGKVDVRMVDSRVVVAMGESNIEGDMNPDGSRRSGRRDSIFTAVAVKKRRAWKLVAFQNTNVAR